MASYIIKRLAFLIPTLILLTIIVFLLVRLVPGNVIDVMVSEMYGGAIGLSAPAASPVNRAQIEHRLGLDVPIPIQYGRWIGFLPTPDQNTGEIRYNGIIQGNFGISMRSNLNLTRELAKRMPVTFQLSLMSMIITCIIGIPLGIYSAIRQDTWLDYVGRSFAVLSLAVPSFWLATIVIVYGAIYLHWSPAMEYVPFSVNPIENLKILILPAVLMGTSGTGGVMRYLRTITLEVLRQDYVRTAWAKGLKERVIVIRHALKNAMIPLLNMFIPMIGTLIGGSVIIEQIFNLPGMGRYTFQMIVERDYPIVSGSNLIFGGVTLFVILITDLSYAWADPRIRF